MIGSEMALMTVVSPGEKPTHRVAAEQLGVQMADIDQAFGIVPVDPEQGFYAVQVRADRLPPASRSNSYRGPFSNPKIEPFNRL